jgi:hypothetical protein
MTMTKILMTKKWAFTQPAVHLFFLGNGWWILTNPTDPTGMQSHDNPFIFSLIISSGARILKLFSYGRKQVLS